MLFGFLVLFWSIPLSQQPELFNIHPCTNKIVFVAPPLASKELDEALKFWHTLLPKVQMKKGEPGDSDATTVLIAFGVDPDFYTEEAFAWAYSLVPFEFNSRTGCLCYRHGLILLAPKLWREVSRHRQEALVHEIGHIIGFKDESTKLTIMAEQGWGFWRLNQAQQKGLARAYAR
ncbi:MAG: hypothetical protein KW806_00805 [Candidatus Yanofskybacteria bacterium]|nr:hypothetical protein [Candidatus Yanofskybacteria bacterium]